MVFYRKYRPQTIAELDLESVRLRLSSILSAKDLPHAFLFTGPKGLGKTSSARILAKAINCENKKGIEPCNSCDPCKSITAGSNLDVIEIDAASNRGIDEIRDLREKIKYAPSNLSKKVYIIDEVHMLTTDAFNALLKTLEEPPGHAVFILCTTEEDKVPATISSRTFHVIFRLPTEAEVIHSLERIIKGEGVKVEDGVLKEVFKLSEGSFRDAAKIFEDLVINAEGASVTVNVLEQIFKTGTTALSVKSWLLAVSKKDVKESLKLIDELAKKGADFKIVTEKVANTLHEVIMARAGLYESAFDLPSLSTNELSSLLSKVNDSYKNIKFSVLPQIPIELVSVVWCLEEESKNENPDKHIVETPIVKSPQGIEEKVEAESAEIPKEQAKDTKAEESGARDSKLKRDDMFDENALSTNFLSSFIALLKRDNHSIAGILRGCKLVEIKDGKVIFETKYKFHKDKLNDHKSREILDRRASELFKKDMQVVVNLAG